MVVLPAAPELGEMEVTQVALSEAVRDVAADSKVETAGELETLAVGGDGDAGCDALLVKGCLS